MTLKLAELRLSVRPGQGMVARFPSAILVVTSAGWAGFPMVDRLLEECASEVDGGSLPHRLSALVDADPQKFPAFCAVADDDAGLALFVFGDTQVVITGAQPGVSLSGRDSSGWTGRIHDRVGSFAISPATGDTDTLAVDPHSDLREGVVPGSAVLLIPRDARIEDRPVGPAAPPADPSRPAVEEVEAEPARVHGSAPLVATEAQQESPAVVIVPASPGPGGTGLKVPAAAVDGEPAMVWGVHCKRGHFNNPDARYCRMCGTHMVHQRRDPVLGPRPVLGFLVLDDGSTFKLDVDYVIGRRPDDDDSVRAGDARGLAISDAEDAVSAVHARVLLDQWNVLVADCDSRYGTHLWTPGSAGWVRLKAGDKTRLEPGTHLLLGRRTIVFDSLNRR